MFSSKLGQVVGVWGCIVICYIIIAATMGIHVAMVNETQAAFATQNLTGIVGVNDAVGAWPLVLWFIPGLVGVVFTVVRLRMD